MHRSDDSLLDALAQSAGVRVQESVATFTGVAR
jgi:hypothetical protein